MEKKEYSYATFNHQFALTPRESNQKTAQYFQSDQKSRQPPLPGA